MNWRIRLSDVVGPNGFGYFATTLLELYVSMCSNRKVERERKKNPRSKVDLRPPYRIVSGQSDEWRLLFFVRLAIELLTAGSQAADGAGFQ